MIRFLEKLNRTAEGLVNNMDNQLQTPLVRLMRGEVFSDGLNNEDTEKEKRKSNPTNLTKNR